MDERDFKKGGFHPVVCETFQILSLVSISSLGLILCVLVHVKCKNWPTGAKTRCE